MKRHLVLMAKAPRMGNVKSRLARQIGKVAAWVFYRRTLFGVARRLTSPRWQCWLSISPDKANPATLPKHWMPIAQGSGDLGARMHRPFVQLPLGPVVLIGSDIPAIQPSHIAAAFAALKENDFVFGPATDGGFWLVGSNRFPHAFNPYDGVRWSSPNALNDTLKNLPDGCRIGFVETLSDVDHSDDLKL